MDQTKENDIYNKIDQFSSNNKGGFKKETNPATSVSKNYISGLKSNPSGQPSYTGKDLAIYEDKGDEIKYLNKAVPQRASKSIETF